MYTLEVRTIEVYTVEVYGRLNISERAYVTNVEEQFFVQICSFIPTLWSFKSIFSSDYSIWGSILSVARLNIRINSERSKPHHLTLESERSKCHHSTTESILSVASLTTQQPNQFRA